MDPKLEKIQEVQITPDTQIPSDAPNFQNIIGDTSVFNPIAKSFEDVSVRHAFIRKVGLVVMSQLITTAVNVASFMTIPTLKTFIQDNLWICFPSLVLFIIMYFVVLCPWCGCDRNKCPWNLIILLLFTLSGSFTIAVISSYYTQISIVYALGAIILIVFILVLFACQKKCYFCSTTSIICLFSITFAVFFITSFLYIVFVGSSELQHLVINGTIFLLGSLELIYDAKLIVEGKFRAYKVNPDEYIMGALSLLYLGQVNIFANMFGWRKK